MDRRSFLKNTFAVSVFILGTCAWLRPSSSPAISKDRLLRPPGALPEPEFLSRCIQCLRCADACPNRTIITITPGDGKHLQFSPVIKPRRQACMLCNTVEGDYLRCTEACPTGALQKVYKSPESIQQSVAIGTAEIDRALCYSYNSWICGACYRACPFPGKALVLGLREKPEVNPDACIGCGACERACISYPQAIRVKKRAV